tara:strand:- start:609 stop:896 length:288 start_codon:yes stop_codon:yes gene_type:complete
MMLSIVCGLAATAAATFIGLRAQMLKPNVTSWPDAPLCVRYSTFGLSAVLGGYVVGVVNGYQPSSGEAVILVALAIYGGLLWLNLLRQVQARTVD